MAEKNKGARRRRAFADFKETQYNDSFSLSAEQKKKKTASKFFKWIAIVLATAVFIIIGFLFTDALMNISEKEYNDPNTYTPSYVNTTTAVTEETEDSSESETQEQAEAADQIINPENQN